MKARSIPEAIDLLHVNQIHVLLLDKGLRNLAGKIDSGIDSIPKFLELNPGLQILVVTASKDFKDCV